MENKYYNDGVVGNNKIKASFTKNGEMLRLFYGYADYKQFLDYFHVGIKVNDSSIIYLHDDINNVYYQEYVENTNVLETEIYNTYFRTRIKQIDFVPQNENVLVKKYEIKNENKIDLNINFLVHSKILTNINNDTSGFVKNNALIQYNHDFSVSTFSDKEMLSKQINGASNNFSSGIIGGKDYVGMSSDSAISYDLNTIKPGETAVITLFVFISKNKEIEVLNELDNEINRIRVLDVKKLQEETEEYWREFLKEHDAFNLRERRCSEQIKKIYNRTILLFPLLINYKTGGISAGIEVDESKTNCGRYSYCWTRDAVFITEALDLIKMDEESEKFYNVFCKMTQYDNGMWEQRFYTDGRLAPCWGYQIDETASVVFGAYAHYKSTKNKEFLNNNLSMLEKAISFLEKYIDDVLEEKNQMQKSYDIWEEYEGKSLYSIASCYAAFSAMISVYKLLREDYMTDLTKLEECDKRIDHLRNLALKVQMFCSQTFYDETKNSYVRNTDDRRIDISIVGTITPFKMFMLDDDRVKNTIDRINEVLKTPTGGYLRYENDGYMGGDNPWPIATLWMAWYYLQVNDIKNALSCFEFVTATATNNGLLAEQIDNTHLEPVWVIGLTWSHAMYIIILKKLLEKGII